MNLDRRRFLATLLSLLVASSFGYWWTHGTERDHETIIFVLVFAVTAIIDVVFLLARAFRDLQVATKRIEEQLSQPRG